MQTLTSVVRYTTKKDGSALLTKKGVPYTSIRIKTQEYGDKLISGFGNSTNATWKAGDIVDIEIKPNGEYLNFEMPKKEDMGPAAGSAASAELKNILQLQVMPMLERNNAGVQHVEFLIKALGDRLEYYLKQGAGEVEDDNEPPMPEF